MTKATELELIRRASGGDEVAMHRLYVLHSDRVMAISCQLSTPGHPAEDIAQETWLRALRSLPRFEGRSRFSTWLHRIAVNSARSRYRRRSWSMEEAGHDPDAQPSGRDASPLQRVALERGLARLSSGMREILLLHDVAGYTHAEIGLRLGIAEGTSKSQLSRARAKLRCHLLEGEVAAAG